MQERHWTDFSPAHERRQVRRPQECTLIPVCRRVITCCVPIFGQQFIVLLHTSRSFVYPKPRMQLRVYRNIHIIYLSTL